MSEPTTSARFKFISGDQFRASLESDHEELERAQAAKAWKAVPVLAGSIIETVLIDYLVSLGPPQVAVDPLTLDLGMAIDLSLKLRILSEKTAHLCHAVRHYRNLIHPGRSIRLKERADENGAQVAYALVGVVLADVESQRKAVYGYTAEQIATKVESDSSALSILPHLLKDTNAQEQERLLLDVLPQRYFVLIEDPFDNDEAPRSLKQCFRSTFDSASEATKRKVLKKLAKVLREEEEHVVLNYERVFFRGADLAFASPEDKALIKQHVLSRADKDGFDALADALDGIEPHLESEDLSKVVDIVVKNVVRNVKNPAAASRARNYLPRLQMVTSGEQDKLIEKRLDEWIQHLAAKGNEPQATAVREIQESINSVPFQFLPMTTRLSDEPEVAWMLCQ
jgi:hypothetical protein